MAIDWTSLYRTPPFFSEDSTNSPGLGAMVAPQPAPGVPGMAGADGSNVPVPGNGAPQAPDSYDKRRLMVDTMPTPRAQAEAELANEKPNWGMGKKVGVGILATLAGAFSKGHGAEVGAALNPNIRYQRKLSERIAEVAKDQQFALQQQAELARIEAEKHQRELQDQAAGRDAAGDAQRLQLGEQALAKGAKDLAAPDTVTVGKDQAVVDKNTGKVIAQGPNTTGNIKRSYTRPTGEVTNQQELTTWNAHLGDLNTQLQKQTAQLQSRMGELKTAKARKDDATVASLQSQIAETKAAIAEHEKGRPKAVRGKTTETREYTQAEADQIDTRLRNAQAYVDGTIKGTPEQVRAAQAYIDTYGTR